MKTINKTKGNLIALAKDGEFDIIVHGCNCWNNMGAGIALEIANKFPQAYQVDRVTQSGDYNKLGNYTKAYGFGLGGNFTIVNAYTQNGMDARKGNDLFEYHAFALILQKLEKEFGGVRYGLPYIGMGLAGGNPNIIIPMIEEFSDRISKIGGSVTLVEWDGVKYKP